MLAGLGTAQIVRADDGSEFTIVEWSDLIPAEDLEALMSPPAYLADIEEGSLEDQASGELRNASSGPAEDAYSRALVSTNVNEELNGREVRIPGFVVPLEFNDDQFVTEFLLVPYFGACIHLPAPPPNQIVMVSSTQGMKLDDINLPFWISGVMRTTVTENDVATSAYALEMQEFEPYEE